MGNCVCTDRRTNDSELDSIQHHQPHPLKKFYQQNSLQMNFEFREVFEQILQNKKSKINQIKITKRLLTQKDWQVFNTILEELPDLKEIVLIDTSLGSHLQKFSKPLKRMKFLQKLVLANNKLEDGDFCVLSDCLLGMKSLKELDLSGNKISKQALSNLCIAIPQMENLEILNIRNNGLSSRNIKRVARCVQELQKLERFLMDSNKLSLTDVTEIRTILPLSALL